MRVRLRVLVALLASLALLGPLAWLWAGSLVPASYSMGQMGYADFGGGPRVLHAAATARTGGGGHTGHTGPGPAAVRPVSVRTLTGPRDRPADVSTTLVARAESFDLSGGQGRRVDGFTLDHSSPGPLIRARQGDLVQVRLVNESVADGVSLHWHGVDVPNAEDGVAGVTQDAVPAGGEHVYRFVAEDAGTYWYHSHQVSHEQVRRGLYGALVVDPAKPDTTRVREVVAPVHTYDGVRTVAGHTGQWSVDTPPGSPVRVRVVNTDDGPLRAWVSGATYQVTAVDGTDVHGPTPVDGAAVVVTAGGRVDLAVTVPSAGAARVSFGGSTSMVLGPPGSAAPDDPEPAKELDLLHYGRPAPLGFDPARADRQFDYRIGRRPGFLDGRPGLWWTINGKLFPDVPMYMVAEGDVVRMRLSNDSGEVHPMHLHGHHVVVLARDDVAATGSPWWVDSLNVEDGHTYDVAFVADNPGIWMDHCHNLPHATEGLVTHLAYAGVTTPYEVGGGHGNQPE